MLRCEMASRNSAFEWMPFVGSQFTLAICKHTIAFLTISMKFYNIKKEKEVTRKGFFLKYSPLTLVESITLFMFLISSSIVKLSRLPSSVFTCSISSCKYASDSVIFVSKVCTSLLLSVNYKATKYNQILIQLKKHHK